MTEIRFYHLERQSLEQALPALLNKAYKNGHRIVVKAGDPNMIETLNTHLWTYHPDQFLPHGSKKDGFAEDQPIWLTDQDENPNNADVLILTHNAESETIKDYKLCCEIFDGSNQDALKAARGRWKTYKDQGFELTYWQQGAQGWEQKS